MNDENGGSQPEPVDDEPSELTGTDAVLYALADALKTKASKEAVSRLIEAGCSLVNKYAEEMPKRLELQKRAALNGVLLTAFIFLIIATLGWLKVITNESTATLIAALLGYLFMQ